jgi:hypothetical protein
MKKFIIGFLSVLLLIGSIMGASSKKPKPARTGRGVGPTMWV